ncbi:MAG: aminotransferase class V-fold PLP-dependent enzyme [Planctomycetes bacterium]|nr:aminotransferase class V-fold PLP-dependent enzyme [Planctomycetota bacterium]
MASIYEQFGVRAGINARGNQTLLGGSTPPQEVQEAMDEALTAYCSMEELLRKTGDFIANTLGTEGAFVTSGAAAAIALSSAAALCGSDREKMAQIPDTSHMKNEFVFQKCQDYSYKRCFTIPGAKLVEVGTEQGCKLEQIEKAIGPKTAAIAYYESGRWGGNVVSLQKVREIARKHNIPVVVDAAGQIYPLDQFTKVARGGDIVAFGAKYFGSPHSTGICTGRKDLVESAFQQNFIGFESAGQKGLARPFGRPFKTDRGEVIAVAVALRRWFSMNHEERLIAEDAKRRRISTKLAGVRGVSTKVPTEPQLGPNVVVNVHIDPALAGKSAAQVMQELEEGNPPIWTRTLDGGKSIGIGVQVLTDEEVEIVADRLKAAVSK